jgi:hypothetical protein
VHPGGSLGKLRQAARALYAPATAGKSRLGGFDLGRRAAPQDVEVWPENWNVVRLFMALATQWREGFHGRTGLVYASVYPLLDRMTEGQPPGTWEQSLADIRLMEAEALAAMRGNTPQP